MGKIDLSSEVSIQDRENLNSMRHKPHAWVEEFEWLYNLVLSTLYHNKDSKGAENLPKNKTKALVSTHSSHSDYLLTGADMYENDFDVPIFAADYNIAGPYRNSKQFFDKKILEFLENYSYIYPRVFGKTSGNLITLLQTELLANGTNTLIYPSNPTGLSKNGAAAEFDTSYFPVPIRAQKLANQNENRDIIIVPEIISHEIVPDFAHYGDAKFENSKFSNNARIKEIINYGKLTFKLKSKGDITIRYLEPVDMKQFLEETEGMREIKQKELLKQKTWGQIIENLPLQNTDIVAYAMLTSIFSQKNSAHFTSESEKKTFEEVNNFLNAIPSDPKNYKQIEPVIVQFENEIRKPVSFMQLYNQIRYLQELISNNSMPMASNVNLNLTGETIDRVVEISNNLNKKIITGGKGLLNVGPSENGASYAFLMYANRAKQIIEYHMNKNNPH